ncbi:MAG: HEAT repeat domain-containing protein [Verrucomicrobia bacterium]|nr:HEAT repeat domain-containing protein [Verrucomicrobiota bacterium]
MKRNASHPNNPNDSPPMNRTRVSPRTMGLALLLAATLTRAQPADPFHELATWQFGKSREPLALIETQIRQTPPADYGPIEHKLLTALQAPTTPKDAKRYICRWLAVVGSPQCVPHLAPLLSDPDLSHPARMALEPLPYAAADAALRQALPNLQGNLLAGIVASLGTRRDPQAVPALIKLTASPDPLVADTTLRALGQIATTDAARALEQLRPPPEHARTLARAQITAASHLASEGHGPQAAALYRRLLQEPPQPPAIRAAALKGLIAALPPADAAVLILDTLQGHDSALRQAAIAAFTGSGDPTLKSRVVRQLPGLSAAGQITLLGVLAEDPHAEARDAVLKSFDRREDVQVRAAAIACLARHGQADDVPMLVRLAHSPAAPIAEAARRTLQHMSAEGTDATLVRLIQSPDAADRAVVLSTLASRRVEAALPALARLTTGTDSTLATEAAKALGVMGTADQLPALTQVLAGTRDSSLRAAAENAAASICRRAPDKAAAAAPVLSALNQAATPEAHLSLLPLLGITPGKPALTAVTRALESSHPAVQDAAVRALASWPDASAMAPLLSLARTTANPTHAILALRDGCLRLAAMDETPLATRLELYRHVLDLAKRTEEKKQAVAGLAHVPAVGALDVLRHSAGDAALRNDALRATTRVARQLGSVYPKRAMAALQEARTMAADPALQREIEQAIDAVRKAGQSPDGYIVAWLLSGPYHQNGKSGTDLFDIPFAPEQASTKADWRPVTTPAGGRPGLIELDKTLGGNNRTAYVRTQITAAQACPARLEMGSDDGIKVWLNGKVVHANNTVRPNSPNQDKADIQLQAGPNTLLLKITQDGGEWSVCCRLRAPDGKELPGVTVAPQAE